MKRDTEKPLTIGAKRTLKALREVMEDQLEKKSFDQIQIKELCEESMIPRATFYNYFEDKYDLLDYIFSEELAPVLGGTTYEEIIAALFDNAEKYQTHLAKILKKNPVSSTFVQLYEQFFRGEVYRYIYKSGVYDGYDIPHELLAQVTADVILDVYEWVYIKGNQIPREEIGRYIEKMLIQ